MIKVLVVDDDEDLLEMVTLMLTTSSMQVSALNSGALLSGSLIKCTPDILLMDIFLGDLDGRLLCKELKSSPTYSSFPVILYSAGEISATSIVESGANFFLRKPFEMKHLIGQIYESVKK